MSKKSLETIYAKILRDVERHHSDSNIINYEDTKATFRVPPSPDELEGLLIWLNKDKLPHA
tara:strand:+ start:432 stop:614 length:183 start_codon:yes stop_codon:yes gene_type:complete